MQEMQVRSLGREDPLEKEMATHSSILARKIPWTEEARQSTIHKVAKGWTRLYLDFISFRLFGGKDNLGSKLREKWYKVLNLPETEMAGNS